MAIQTIARLQNRRGLYADLPTSLAEGEFGWCLDTRQLFIGNSNGYGANTEVLTAYSHNDELITTIYSANGINLSSAISRTLHAKLDDIASIKDFGAIGDGVTDDAPAINAAISELLKGYPASNNTAVSIFFPAGTYLINSTLLLYPYLSIIGDGNNGTTILAAPGTSMQYMLETVDSLGQTGANIGLNGAVLPTKVHIRDISINTNSQQISAVHSTRYTHIRYERVNVRGGWVSGNPAGTDSAFTCSSIGNAVFTHDLQLVDCDIQGFTNAVLMNDPVAYTTLSRCTLHQLYRGIVAGLTPAYNGPEYTTITQTKFYSISNYGIYVGDASSNPGVTSIGNTFKSVGTPTSVKSIYWGTASVLNGSMGDVFSTAPGVIDNGATNIIVDAQQTNLTGVSGTSGYSGYSGVFNSSSNASSATVIATGSTTARTLGARAADTVNVLDYGAITGSSNATANTNAFLAAISALSTASDYRGGVLYIPSGQYFFNQTLTVTAYDLLINIWFVGEGPNSTELDFTLCAAGSDGIAFSNGSQFGVSNLSINAAPRNGISVNYGQTPGNPGGSNAYSQQCSFENLRIQGCGASGINVVNTFLVDMANIWSRSNGSNGISMPGFSTTVLARRVYCSDNTNGAGFALNGVIGSNFIACAADRNKWGVTGVDVRSTTFQVYGEQNSRELFNFTTSLAAEGSLPSGSCGLGAITLSNCKSLSNNYAGPAGSYAGLCSVTTANSIAADLIIIACDDTPAVPGTDVSLSINGTSGTVTSTILACDLTPINVYTGSYSVTDSTTRGMLPLEVIPGSGGNYTIPVGVTYLSLNPAGTLATFTLNLPPNPHNGTTLIVSTTQAITALTVSNGTNNAPNSMAANSTFGLTYVSSVSAWRRSQ